VGDTPIDTDAPLDTDTVVDTPLDTDALDTVADTPVDSDTDTDTVVDTPLDSDVPDTDADTTAADTDLTPDTGLRETAAVDADTDTDLTPDTRLTDTAVVDTGFPAGPWSCIAGDTADSAYRGWNDTGASSSIHVDGDDSEWTWHFVTSSAGSSRANLVWSYERLLFGLSHPDLATPSADRYVVAYIGDPGATALSGLRIGGQRPALPGPARWAVRWRTDDGALELWRAVSGRWIPQAVPHDLIARSTPGTVELAVPFTLIGCGAPMGATWMIVDADSGLTYAANPAHAIEDGADPDIACVYRFDPSRENAYNQIRHQCDQPPSMLDTGETGR